MSLERLRRQRRCRRAEAAQAADATDRVHLETLLDHMPGVLIYLNREARVVWLNDRHAKALGGEAAACIGKSLYEVMPYLESPIPQLTEAIETGKVTRRSPIPVFFDTDGRDELRFYDNTYVPLTDDAGGVEGVLICGLDISDRIEKEILQTGRMAALRQAAAVKDEFVAVASHELRTPLAAIRSAAAILAKGRAGALNEAQARFAQLLLNQADHLRVLADNLLDLQKLESGNMSYELVAGDLVGLAREVLDGFEPLAQDKGLSLLFAHPDEDLVVRFDRTRMAQVLLNLLSNALKFTPVGGSIALSLAGRDEAVVVEVADTGVGIAPQDTGRIFDKFVQAGHSIQREAGGTGLGLPIARRIVEEGHGGRLELESTPGVGSCFRVILPMEVGLRPA